MNILLCLPYEISAPQGNSIAARRLAKGFQAAGHQVTLLDRPNVNSPQLIRDTIAAARPQVCLLLHAWRCAKAFHLIQHEAGIPTLVALRGTDLNEMLDAPATREQILGVLSGCRAISVFCSSGKATLLAHESSWEGKIRVIPNGGGLSAPSCVDFRARLGIPANAFLFVSVTGLREVKRPTLVIPWLARLRQEFPAIALAHAGPSIEAAVTAELTELRTRFPWISHLDLVAHEEIDSFLRGGQVFVSGSRSEGMPHAVREAMLCGMPLLLSDIPGHRQMADPEREALFFANEEDFGRQARRLLLDPGAWRRDLGQRARARAEKELAQNDEIALYLEVLHDLIAEGVSA